MPITTEIALSTAQTDALDAAKNMFTSMEDKANAVGSSRKAEKRNANIRINTIAHDALIELFTYLGNTDLPQAFLVCRKWAGIEKDSALRRQMVRNFAFGVRDWEEFYGEVGEEPPISGEMYEALQGRCPFSPASHPCFPDAAPIWRELLSSLPVCKVGQTHVLTLIPETVNEKPLTLNSLREMIKHPKQGPRADYNNYAIAVAVGEELGDKPTPQSHWVFMTKRVCQEWQDMFKSDRHTLEGSFAKVGSSAKKISLELPSALDTAVSVLMQYMKTRKRLFITESRQDKGGSTRCQDKRGNQEHVVVGDFFESEGHGFLTVDSSILSNGAAISWKF